MLNTVPARNAQVLPVHIKHRFSSDILIISQAWTFRVFGSFIKQFLRQNITGDLPGGHYPDSTAIIKVFSLELTISLSTENLPHVSQLKYRNTVLNNVNQVKPSSSHDQALETTQSI